VAGVARVDFDKADLPAALATDPDQLLTAAEVAVVLRVSERWVQDSGRSGRLPSVPLGRNRRYRRGTVLEYVARSETL
jgi:excisionase family DNA binding protein